MRLVEQADGLIEGFRPGVMERLGLGPDVCLARNPRLVYGRMTGWGQDGPLGPTAGHDIDYIAVSGALGAMAREGEKPLPPLNLVGDFGGGGMLMAFGMMCGVFEAQRSGRGQVIDAAMVDGASLMMAMFWGMRDIGAWSDRAGTNVLDSGAHYYNVYETSDERHLAVGAIEPQFYAELLRGLGFSRRRDGAAERQNAMAGNETEVRRPHQRKDDGGMDRGLRRYRRLRGTGTPIRRRAHRRAQQRPQCVRARRRHRAARSGPRFSRTAATIGRGADVPGASTDAALAAWGFSAEEIDGLRAGGALG